MVGPGGTLGYRSLFADEPYQASAIAVEDCEVTFVSKRMSLKCSKLVLKWPCSFWHRLPKIYVLLKKWLDQIDKGAAERIAEALVFLHEHFSHQNWTRREIAQWAGIHS